MIFRNFFLIFLIKGIFGLLKLPQAEEGKPRLLVENWKNDVVYLVQYPRIESLPSLSIKCLLIESWLKIKNVQFFRINNHFMLGSPHYGTIPFVQFNGNFIEGSENIMKSLDHLGMKLERNSNENQIIGIVDEILIPLVKNFIKN
ncbi:unnamed protein product [Meloidogyne enterolobii]|uniref:Uncharacterized protein n=1 Tax=Meloidogyne enterolobii TaxID=390850 RepID=A0ACB1AGM4_MELEN